MGKKTHRGHVAPEKTLRRSLNTFVYNLPKPHQDLVAGIIEAEGAPEDPEECARLVLKVLGNQGVSKTVRGPLLAALLKYKNDIEYKKELMCPKHSSSQTAKQVSGPDMKNERRQIITGQESVVKDAIRGYKDVPADSSGSKHVGAKKRRVTLTQNSLASSESGSRVVLKPANAVQKYFDDLKKHGSHERCRMYFDC